MCATCSLFGVANNLHSLARVQFGVGAQRSGAPSCHRECGVGAQRSGAPRSPPNASPAQRGPRRDFSALITYVPGGFDEPETTAAVINASVKNMGARGPPKKPHDKGCAFNKKKRCDCLKAQTYNRRSCGASSACPEADDSPQNLSSSAFPPHRLLSPVNRGPA